jgi:hypothetical protein
MSWSLEFDDPIPLASGKPLARLRDAAEHVMALPRATAELEHWETAIACLIAAAKKRALMMMARIAMMQALVHGQEEPVPTPRRNAAKKYRIVS